MKMFKKFCLACIFITTFLLIYIIVKPTFVLEEDTFNVGEEVNLNVRVYNLLFDFSDKLISTGTVDNAKLGDYNIEYKFKFLFLNIKKNFKIHIIDKVSPNIILNGNNPSYVCPGNKYIEEGYEITDNYDTNINDNITIQYLENEVIYKIWDNSNNISTIKRNIIYEDKDNPVISLKGNSSISIYVGKTFYDPGYTASDNCDGDITDKVFIEGTVNNSKTGTYTIKYSVTDTSGNSSSVERIVKVIKNPYTYGDGVIYLTFDDGPSSLTNEVLDILDKYNVKATFFVTHANSIVARAYNSGHTIGLHTYSHNYSYIYSSSNNFFNDLDKVSDEVYNTIGIRSKIIRFPGGSSNTVSRNYCKGIMSYLSNEVVNRGYNYFDWNISSGDASSPRPSSSKIYNNVVNSLSHKKTNVVLMHDSGGHRTTVEALDDIIEFGLEYGYTFKEITDSTPVVRHGVNN